jgi:predicted nuclease of predicted toxin-antitoxin system
VRFLIDAQLPPGLMNLLVDAGHEAVHVTDVGLLTEPDTTICAYAVREEMIVVTKDEDFVQMRLLSTEVPRVLWIRIGNATNRILALRVQPRLGEALTALESGEEVVEIR